MELKQKRTFLGTKALDSDKKEFKFKMDFEGWYLAKNKKELQDFYIAIHKFMEEQELKNDQ